ncbi:MAG: plasmid pRiA4b ORF-3 family protein, partial [Bacteroidota bacterium]
IQTTFGWLGYHMHQFSSGREYYAPPSPYDFDDFAEDYAGLTLADFLQAPKDKLIYEYDFGDSWEHRIELEKVLPPAGGATYPRCIKGKRHRPPEDVGGVWGYEHFLAAIQDPKHPEHEELLEWAGGKFDPEAINLREINLRLGVI